MIQADDEYGRPWVVKVLKAREGLFDTRIIESQREAQACELLELSNDSNDKALIRAELISITREKCSFKVLKMPQYNVLVERASYEAVHIAQQGQRLIEAVQFIHQKEFIHMDIKGSNIFVDVNGQWLLGDFGSICPIGFPVSSCTTMFCKENVIGLNAQPKFDWFMLLIVLMIETLEDRHAFLSALYDSPNSQEVHVSESKLRSLILGITCEPLRVVVRDILERLDPYFELEPPASTVA